MHQIPVVLLSCGSFNPPTNMHLRMFEIAKDHLNRTGLFRVVGGLISPVHNAYQKQQLIKSEDRCCMVRLALKNGSDWVKLTDWECRQEGWNRTRTVLQYHQNAINAAMMQNDNSTNWPDWLPDYLQKFPTTKNVKVKLLCGADLLETFSTPGLWQQEDLETIVGEHGLVVITRGNNGSGNTPSKMIYESDLLTRFFSNIIVVNEWITNEISSTKIRTALRRRESVRYLLPDNVLEYIYQQGLYNSNGSEETNDFNEEQRKTIPKQMPSKHMLLTIDTVDSPSNSFNAKPKSIPKPTNQQPKQKQQTKTSVVGRTTRSKVSLVRASLSCAEMTLNQQQQQEHSKIDKISKGHGNSSSDNDVKSCDENLIRFILTKHGIQVISDIETVV